MKNIEGEIVVYVHRTFNVETNASIKELENTIRQKVEGVVRKYLGSGGGLVDCMVREIC